MPTKLVLYIDYARGYKKILNLKKPLYYGEKIQWIKLNGNLERYGKFVDKYEVRKYIELAIGEKYINKVYGVYKRPEEINFQQLPQTFVIKMTNGTSANIICKDKSNLNIKSTIKKLKKWQREKIYKYTKELQYKNVESKIICEEYLEDETGSLRDYKFHCSNGKVYLIEVFTDRFTDYKENFYDVDWNECETLGRSKKVDCIERPSNLEEMLSIVQVLSKKFHYVRIDLYSVKGKIYFGEFTFTPSSGREGYYPLEKDIEIAAMININDYIAELKLDEDEIK